MDYYKIVRAVAVYAVLLEFRGIIPYVAKPAINRDNLSECHDTLEYNIHYFHFLILVKWFNFFLDGWIDCLEEKILYIWIIFFQYFFKDWISYFVSHCVRER